MPPVLKVEGLSMNFGGLRALDAVDLSVGRQEIVALIGPNGAGKTTFFNCLTGIYRPTSGNIYMQAAGAPTITLNGLPPHEITQKGLARTFQNIRLFPEMTVLENVMIGCHCRTSGGIFSAIFRPKSIRDAEQQIVEGSYEILGQMGLADVANDLAHNLPYGAQRRLEIARALATEATVLLLDEPAAGMNSRETLELDQLIVKIRDTYKLSILLIEHDMKLVMSISDRIYVMDYGRRIAAGTPQEIKENPVVIKAYLGE